MTHRAARQSRGVNVRDLDVRHLGLGYKRELVAPLLRRKERSMVVMMAEETEESAEVRFILTTSGLAYRAGPCSG